MAYSYDDRDREFRQSPPPRPPRKEDNDLGSWILIIFLFIVAWPAGLAVLLSKVLGNDSRRKNAARSTRSTVSRSDPAVSRANPNPSQARPGTASAAGRKVTKTPQYSAKAARNMKIVGLVLLFAGLVSLVEGIGAATGGLSWALLASLFPTMGLAAGGLGLLLAGGVMTRRARRFGKYLACAHGQEAVSLKKLAEAADVKQRAQILMQYLSSNQGNHSKDSAHVLEEYMRQRIYATDGNISIQMLSRETGYSECYAECLRKSMGSRPKSLRGLSVFRLFWEKLPSRQSRREVRRRL